MNNENNKPKPHPHAHWIKLWADGVPIEYKAGTGQWVDVIQFSTMTMPDVEYRIKPEVAVPRVKAALKGDTTDDMKVWLTENDIKGGLQLEVGELKNRFRKLSKENEQLKIHGAENLDGKLLTDGEKALIKVLRKYPLTQVHGVDFKSTLVHFGENGIIQTKTSHIAVWSEGSSPATDKALKDAFVKIKVEQEEAK